MLRFYTSITCFSLYEPSLSHLNTTNYFMPFPILSGFEITMINPNFSNSRQTHANNSSVKVNFISVAKCMQHSIQYTNGVSISSFSFPEGFLTRGGTSSILALSKGDSTGGKTSALELLEGSTTRVATSDVTLIEGSIIRGVILGVKSIVGSIGASV